MTSLGEGVRGQHNAVLLLWHSLWPMLLPGGPMRLISVEVARGLLRLGED